MIVAKKHEAVRAGCVFAKSCKLPDAIIDYSNPSGMVPTDSLKDYGEVAWLGAREVDDAGLLNLETISGSTVSLGIGRLALRAPRLAVPATALGAAGAAVLAGVVALFWTPSLGDSALYTEDQLRALKQAELAFVYRSSNRLTAVSRDTVSTPARTAIGKWSMSCSSVCAAASRWRISGMVLS